MHGVVEKTPDTGRLNAVSLCLQIKQLADDTAFPVKPPVKPRAVGNKHLLKLGKHGHGKYAVGRDLLMTTHAFGEFTAVTAGQPVQWQAIRATFGMGPVKLFTELRPQVWLFRRIARQKIKPRWNILHPVHEQQEMHARRPWQRIEGKSLGPRQAA